MGRQFGNFLKEPGHAQHLSVISTAGFWTPGQHPSPFCLHSGFLVTETHILSFSCTQALGLDINILGSPWRCPVTGLLSCHNCLSQTPNKFSFLHILKKEILDHGRSNAEYCLKWAQQEQPHVSSRKGSPLLTPITHRPFPHSSPTCYTPK